MHRGLLLSLASRNAFVHGPFLRDLGQRGLCLTTGQTQSAWLANTCVPGHVIAAIQRIIAG